MIINQPNAVYWDKTAQLEKLAGRLSTSASSSQHLLQMNKTNYNALTDDDLRQQLAWEHYVLHWTEDENHLELFTFRNAYLNVPYREESTGEVFDSVQEAHRYAFTL
jgi:hypothetical protein